MLSVPPHLWHSADQTMGYTRAGRSACSTPVHTIGRTRRGNRLAWTTVWALKDGTRCQRSTDNGLNADYPVQRRRDHIKTLRNNADDEDDDADDQDDDVDNNNKEYTDDKASDTSEPPSLTQTDDMDTWTHTDFKFIHIQTEDLQEALECWDHLTGGIAFPSSES